MPREKRDPTRYRAGRGDARKTMSEAGWPSDIRIRNHTLRAKWLHWFLWDRARVEMRQILPAHWSPRTLAAEVGESTPEQIVEALNQLATGGPVPLLAFLPDGRIDVLGIKSIHRALEAWKDEAEAIETKRLPTYPNETKQRQSTVDWTGRDRTGRECTSPPLTGRDVDMESKRTDSHDNATAGSQIPASDSTPNVKGPAPAAATTEPETPAPPELKEARKEYDRVTTTWNWHHFRNGAHLRLKVSSMLRNHDSAQVLLGHVYDVEADDSLASKPANLFTRIMNGQHPPGDDSMALAKEVLGRGDVPIEDIIGKAMT